MANATDTYTEEFLPVPPFVEGNPKGLIIGTFPPARERWDYPFFFPNRQNRLWNTLARVASDNVQYSLPTLRDADREVEARKNILRQLDCAMVNIIRRCTRKNGSALDNDLTVLELEDIVHGYLLPNIGIDRIYLTSLSGGNSCLSLLKRHLRELGISSQAHRRADNSRQGKIADPLEFSFDLGGRVIAVYSLFSPSPTAMRSGITEQVLYDQYIIIRRALP
ncbi:MAG: hypothetical protein U0176_14540 [Bacteroidia bacterium]